DYHYRDRCAGFRDTDNPHSQPCWLSRPPITAPAESVPSLFNAQHVDHAANDAMKSLIKRSKLFRWLAPSGTLPTTAGGAPQPEQERVGRRGVDVFPRLYPSQLEPRIVLNASPVVQLDPSGVLEIDAGEFADD